MYLKGCPGWEIYSSFISLLRPCKPVSQAPGAKANVGGNLTLAILKGPQGQYAFKVSVHEGKRQEIIDRVVQLRQAANWGLHRNIRTRTRETEGR